MTGRTVPILWEGHRVDAYVPEPIAGLDVEQDLDTRTARALERAAGALERADLHLPERFEPLFLLLLRAEGIASSNIEGVRAPLDEVAAAEMEPALGGPAAEVAQNLHAVVEAVRDASRAPLTVTALNRWHSTLMQGAPRILPSHVGVIRDVQSWIGGRSPRDAAYVAPPAMLVPALLEDLVVFANRDDVDPVAQAAVAHVQFESIHPYADGNGRIGRVLIGWILTRRLGLHTPPAVSARISRNRDGYLSQMTLWRQGTQGPWLRWFAEIVESAGGSTLALVDRIAELQASWDERLVGVRADAVARRILEILPAHPVLTAASASEQTGVSERACRDALALLAVREVLTPFTPSRLPVGRPRSWWVADDVVELVGAWARN